MGQDGHLGGRSDVFAVEFLGTMDAFQTERLARSLRDHLHESVGDIRATLHPDQGPIASDLDHVAKSALDLADAGLWVFLGTAAASTARTAIVAINAWSKLQSNRTLRIKTPKLTIEFPVDSDEAQQKLLEKFLEERRR